MIIHCSHDALVDPMTLVEHPRNPNKHPTKQITLLSKIIETSGWRAPITVSRRSGYIIKGHGRLAAALILHADAVPVDYQDYETEAAEWADMVADNRIAELAQIDLPELKDLLIELDAGDVDMDLTGFSNADLEKMMTDIGLPDDKEAEGKGAKECPNCGCQL